MKLWLRLFLMISVLPLSEIVVAQSVGTLSTTGAVATETGELPGVRRNLGPWNLSFRTEASKSLAEYTDWDGSVGGTGSFKYKDYTFSGTLNYLYPFDDTVTVTESRRYGPDDFVLGVRYKDLIDGPIRSLTPVASWSLPTSETSQRATMMSSVSAGVTYTQLEKYLTWSVSSRLVASAYQYETANAFGTSYNSPLGASNSLSLSRTIDKLTFSAYYSLYTYYNYASNIKNLQTIGSTATWAFQREWSLTGYYRWRDDIVTHLSVFDDDTSKAGLILTYSM